MSDFDVAEYQPDPNQIEEFERLSKQIEKDKKNKKKHHHQQQIEQEQRQKTKRYHQRYSHDDLVAEAVIIGGKPKFAMAVPKVGKRNEVSITLQDAIEVDNTTVIKPLAFQSYINKPYTFKSQQEFENVVESVRNKGIDECYKKVKSIWAKYVDADDFHISLCAADTIFTYFQDKIGLTHYLFFVGGNSSGKSNNLTILHYLAYRNMMSSGMTAANVYTYLGSGEEGLGTICEDEADNIDQDLDKMRVNKNGYTTGIPYHRTDTSAGRQQLKFNTFCFKAFAAEKLPDSVSAKGFNQRIIELPCVYGFPTYDISEVMNPAGEEEYEQLLQELHTMRNALLVYRLLHFHDKISNIKLNIQNREKQLFKPVLRVFQDTQTLNELLPVISKYVNQKREGNTNTLHAFLFRLIKDLIKAQNTYELESSLIWNTIKGTLDDGKEIPHKAQSYDTIEFGIISQKGVIETLIQVFSAKPSKRHPGIKTLTFDKDKLQRLSKIYELAIDVKVGSSDVELVDDVEHIGLDKYHNEQSGGNKIDDLDKEKQNFHDKTAENVQNIRSDKSDKTTNASPEAPYAPHVPPTQKQEEVSSIVKHNLYFSFGKWYCNNCKASGDKFYMENTSCIGVSKK